MRVAVTALVIPMLLASASLGADPKRFIPASTQPGDAMINKYLAEHAERLDAGLLDGVATAEEWSRQRARYREEYFHMLGLWPLPERTPLKPVVTGTLDGEGYRVEKLHFQSRPGLYVTANVYRPAEVKPGERLPAVLYVCGHSNMGRDGCKTAYQSMPIWFGRHGYVCLIVDTLQLSEIASIHHGTYRESRFWWYSRGYTPAGVECWNGIRGIDYLQSRPDVDPERIAVTGISGGGAATFWIAGADDRVKVAVPVSGMSDLQSYVGGCLVNGHCDCMFMYNTFRWPWARIAALVAPRPMLFINSDEDLIFPTPANERIAHRMEMFYRLFGAGDLFDTMVSIGGHAYRQDIRQATYRFINTHLKNDPRPITDSEIDVVNREEDKSTWPILPAKLRVFPTDADLPADALNARIDESFVPLGTPGTPGDAEFGAWRDRLVAELRRVSFGAMPREMSTPPAALGKDPVRLTTEPGITITLTPQMEDRKGTAEVKRVVLLVAGEIGEPEDVRVGEDELLVRCYPRGTGETRWTRTNPPNTVERSHALLGSTPDAGRVWDVIASARWIGTQVKPREGIIVRGSGAAGVIGAYAALLEPSITGVIVSNPPASHMDADAPQFLNVLRVCDIADTLGMLAPRPLTVTGAPGDMMSRIAAIYRLAGASDRLRAGMP